MKLLYSLILAASLILVKPAIAQDISGSSDNCPSGDASCCCAYNAANCTPIESSSSVYCACNYPISGPGQEICHSIYTKQPDGSWKCDTSSQLGCCNTLSNCEELESRVKALIAKYEHQ